MGSRIKNDPAGILAAVLTLCVLSAACWYAAPAKSPRATGGTNGGRLTDAPGADKVSHGSQEGDSRATDQPSSTAGNEEVDTASTKDDGRGDSHSQQFDEDNRRRFQWFPDASDDSNISPSELRKRQKKLRDRR
jgi:hypothetical protein